MKYKTLKETSCRVDDIDISILQSRRKTICLYVQPDQSVVVKAPVEMQKKDIADWVRMQKDWITKKRLEIQQKPVRKYVEGELFLFQGKNYPLHIIYDINADKLWVNLVKDKLVICTNTLNAGQIKDLIRKWYIENAWKQYFQRVSYFQRNMKEPVRNICVKEYKSKWGCCSSFGNLSFNWKIIMAPPEILDYIVVHELCHLKHMNHSEAFWKEVEKILPDYKERRRWLKKNGKYLEL